MNLRLNSPKEKILFQAFLVGMFSMMSQIIMMREFLVVFHGNEIICAVSLAAWLLWVACGSLLASRIKFSNLRLQKIVPALLVGQSLLLPVMIVLIRSLKTIFHISVGEIVSIPTMGLSALFVFALISIPAGFIFALLCQLSKEQDPKEDSTDFMVRIYLWESLGAVCGGALFSFVLIHIFNSFQSALFVLFGICAAVLVLHRPQKKKPIIFTGILIFVLLLVLKIDLKIDSFFRQLQWQDLKLVCMEDSIYGNIAITKLENEYSVFENGLHAFSTNDSLSQEEAVHYALLSIPTFKNVLLIGGGVGGQISEILKYQDVKITYLELDPKIISLSRKYLPVEFLESLDDSRVNIQNVDGRLFVKTTQEKFDVVIVSLPDPYTALINRFYTQDFFYEVKRILNRPGILSLKVSSSENYLNAEARDFLRSMNTTLKSVFVDVEFVPGDTQIFVAGNIKNSVDLNPLSLIKRSNAYGLKNEYVNEYYIPFRLDAFRVAKRQDVLAPKGQLNTDIRPIAYLYDTLLWSTHFNSGFKKVMGALKKITWAHAMTLPLMMLVLGLLFLRKSFGKVISLSILTTGFSEIIFQVIVIIAFQVLYGYAYYKVGIILTSFMAGLVLGSFLGRKIIKRKMVYIFCVYRKTQIGIALYPLLLPLIFWGFHGAGAVQKFSGFFASIFALLPILAGFFGGLQYPLAVFLVNQNRKKINTHPAESAGILYGLDVLGAAIGSVVVTLMIPILGINVVAYFCAFLNVVIAVLLFHKKGSVRA